MKKALVSASALALMGGAALAGGIERTTQSALVLFEEGNHAELSYGSVSPSLTGSNVAAFPAQDIDNVAGQYALPSAAIKMDLNEKLSAAIVYDRPFGADIGYEDGNIPLGGTTADANTNAMTFLLKYNLNDNFSIYGGLRRQKAEGEITLRGLAYGAVSGYTVVLDEDWATGYVLGAAYERKDIALRVALTYNSEITHDMATTESGPLIDPDGPGPTPALPLLAGTSTTEVKTPESWNLEFQTGVAPDTLLFGSIRHVTHSQFRVDPTQFVTVTGDGLIDLDDTTTYRLGLGRRFNDRFAGSISLAYEAPGDALVSPLSPSTGYTSLALGGSYAITEDVTLSGGVSYTWVGDAQPETGTPDTARASFEDNTVTGVGLKIAYRF